MIRHIQYRWRHRVRRGTTCSTNGCGNPVYIGTMCRACAGL